MFAVLVAVICFLATTRAFNAQYTLSDHAGLCGKPGAVTSANAKTLKTFNKGSTSAAVSAICLAATAQALGVRSVTGCDSDSVSGRTLLTLNLVSKNNTQFQCKFFVNNVNQCSAANPSTTQQRDPNGGWGSNNDDDDDRGGGRWFKKRQSEFDPPACRERTTLNACRQGCTPSTDLLGDCDCLWDTPTNSAGQPTDGDSCPTGQRCCYNVPCQNWDLEDDCIAGSGGDVNGVGARCDYDASRPQGQQCFCKAPLVPAPPPPPGADSYAPFDCICSAEGYANTTEIAECPMSGNPNGEPPTVAESKLIRRLNFKLALIVSKVNTKTFLKQCKLDRVRITYPRGQLVKFVSSLVNLFKSKGLQVKLEYFADRSGAYLYTPQGYGNRLKTVAEEDLSPEELAAMGPIEIDGAAHASLSLVAAIVAFVAARLF